MHWQWNNCPKGLHGQYRVTSKKPPSYMKQWHRRTCGYGMLFLTRLVRPTISMCSNNLLCTRDFVMEKPHNATTPSTSTRGGAYYQLFVPCFRHFPATRYVLEFTFRNCPRARLPCQSWTCSMGPLTQLLRPCLVVGDPPGTHAFSRGRNPCGNCPLDKQP